MAHCLVNDTLESFDFLPETWGRVLATLDARLVASRRVVTAVRFDGVDQPSFRSANLAAADLSMVRALTSTWRTPRSARGGGGRGRRQSAQPRPAWA